MSSLAPVSSAADNAIDSVGRAVVHHDLELRAQDGKDETRVDDLQGEDPSPDRPRETLLRWNSPRINAYRFVISNFCFLILGMNDGALGALIPYIGEYYDVSYTIISLLFLSPFCGYVLAALTNSLIHHHFGQRGVAIIAPLSRLLGYIALCVHPPYPALPIVNLFPGYGCGLVDGAWNAWIGNMERSNELLGLLHGSYGLGATIGPLIASAMVTRAHLPWYAYYYVMVGAAIIELIAATTAFWGATGAVYREAHKSSTGEKRTTTRTVLREPITWLLSIFLLGYVGAEVSLGGWIVSFMLTVRHTEPFLAGVTVTLFWLGLTVGRVVLGFITGRIGEKFAITLYLGLSIGLEILYWLVPSIAASIVFVIFLGFFLGPLFPAAIVAATKLLPSDYHVSAVGFAAAFGSGGGALVPFAVGAIAERKGVQVLQPIILAILAFILLIWFCIPGGMRRGGLERARETREKPGHEFMEFYRRLKRPSQLSS